MKEATQQFSKERAAESRALVEISRELDRPGLLGVFTFIMPLVVDSIFNKLAPKLFTPNTIAMLQKSENTFRGIRQRKRLERFGQFAVIASFFTGVGIATKQLIRLLSRVSGRRNTTVIATLVGVVAFVTLAEKAAAFLIPGLAPADVLNKTQKSKEESQQLQTIQRYNIDDEDIASNVAGGGI